MLRHPLAREITVIVAVKTALVVAAAVFVFGPQRLHLTPSLVQAHMFQTIPEIGK